MLEELRLFEIIARGIDPSTGKRLNTPKHPAVDKARRTYLARLSRLEKELKEEAAPCTPTKPPSISVRRAKDGLPAMPGHSWSQENDEKLSALWFSPNAPSAEILAGVFWRSTGAILARLVHQGRFPDLESALIENSRRNHNAARVS